METSLLKLAAIGTIGDAVSLRTQENRAFVHLGLTFLREGPHSPGLTALLRVSGFRPGDPISASDIAFKVVPRINAANRLTGDASLVVSLLTAGRSPYLL